MYAVQRGFVVILFAGLLSACGAMIVGGQAHGGRAGAQSADAQRDAIISAAINRLYVRDAQISAFDIRITVRDGGVRLEGRVKDREAERRAVALARSVDGVRRVDARLVIAPR